MTLTDTLQSLWNWFNHDGWTMLVGTLFLAVLFFSLVAGMQSLFSKASSKADAYWTAGVALLVISSLVFLYLYNDDGKWEPHLFGKDVWKPHWVAILVHQALASVFIGAAIALGFNMGWTEKEGPNAASRSGQA